jgi:hypothetical protein
MLSAFDLLKNVIQINAKNQQHKAQNKNFL